MAGNIFTALMDAIGVADGLLRNANLTAADRHKITCIHAAMISWKDTAFRVRGYTTKNATGTNDKA